MGLTVRRKTGTFTIAVAQIFHYANLRWGKSVAQKVERVFILVNNEITKASKATEFRNSPSSHVPCMPMGS
ncbi:hypothetical protein T06_1056 [Trichinella sp. T6]|nr:hypothetical protein T06_1056 [Trichinella sp. T6]